jgi:hypothetical protein
MYCSISRSLLVRAAAWLLNPLESREAPDWRVDHTQTLRDAIVDSPLTTTTDRPVATNEEDSRKRQTVFNPLGQQSESSFNQSLPEYTLKGQNAHQPKKRGLTPF